MAWRVAFMQERCLPSGVRGPVDFCALARFAARRASEMGRFSVTPLGCSLFGDGLFRLG